MTSCRTTCTIETLAVYYASAPRLCILVVDESMDTAIRITQHCTSRLCRQFVLQSDKLDLSQPLIVYSHPLHGSPHADTQLLQLCSQLIQASYSVLVCSSPHASCYIQRLVDSFPVQIAWLDLCNSMLDGPLCNISNTSSTPGTPIAMKKVRNHVRWADEESKNTVTADPMDGLASSMRDLVNRPSMKVRGSALKRSSPGKSIVASFVQYSEHVNGKSAPIPPVV